MKTGSTLPLPREISAGRLTLKKLAEYPIVTHVFDFSGRSSLPVLFETAGLPLDVALTARDSDVIKTYVRIGLGDGVHVDRISPRCAAARLYVRLYPPSGIASAGKAGALGRACRHAERVGPHSGRREDSPAGQPLSERPSRLDRCAAVSCSNDISRCRNGSYRSPARKLVCAGR